MTTFTEFIELRSLGTESEQLDSVSTDRERLNRENAKALRKEKVAQR